MEGICMGQALDWSINGVWRTELENFQSDERYENCDLHFSLPLCLPKFPNDTE
jgi:hypothetical protein